MQPDDRRKTKRQSGISRARAMLKKHIGWLPGYPTEIDAKVVRWQSVAWDGSGFEQSWILDREDLRRAQMTMTKLRHHFPNALPKIVEEVDDWLSRIDFVLDLLKSAIHDAQTPSVEQILSSQKLPSRWVARFASSQKRHPNLKPLFEAICYLELSKRCSVSIEFINWLDRHATMLASLDSIGCSEDVVPLQLRLCSLRQVTTEPCFESLVTSFADPLIRNCPVRDVFARVVWLEQAIAKRIVGSQITDSPQQVPITLFQRIEPLIKTISRHKPKRQRTLLALLDLLLCEETLSEIRDIKVTIDSYERQLLRIFRQLESGSMKIPATRYGKNQLLEKVKLNRSEVDPREAIVQHLADDLRSLPGLDDAKAEQWHRFLRLIPTEHQPLRLALFHHWSGKFAGDGSRIANTFYHTLSKLESIFRRHGVTEWIAGSWKKSGGVTRIHDLDWIIELSTFHDLSYRSIDQSLRLFEQMIYDHQARPGQNLLDSLNEFVQVTSDLDQASKVAAILARMEDSYYSIEELRPAFAFGDDADEIAAILAAFDQSDYYEIVTASSLLTSLASDPFLRPAIVRRILADDRKTLRRIASAQQLSVALGDKPPLHDYRASDIEDWMSIYPEEFRTELKNLVQHTSRAEAICKEILGKEFPNPQHLQSEIDAIASKLDRIGGIEHPGKRSHLKQRLDNLRDRLQQPAIASPARIANLNEKLRWRVEHECIERFVESSRDRIVPILCDRYQIDQLPDELLNPPLDAVLADTLKLSQPMKELGLRLIFETLSRSTRKFDSEPANVTFQSDLEQKGINIDPWLSDTFETRAKTSGGIPYRLSFTRDVIDFLLMGFHFGTCLSPGDCNFFSTVANAVDINKRVVYGKTESGKLIGRCLFALNDDGHILTYHRYAHEAKDRFDLAVDHFAAELAVAMNSSLTKQGTVQNLIAKSWYDDGAIGEDNSAAIDDSIRSLFSSEAPGKLFAGLLAVISRDQICNRLDELVSFEELAKRRDALRGFLSSLAFDDSLSRSQRLVVARVAFDQNNTEVALRSLARIPHKQLIEIVKRTRCDSCNVFHGIGSYRDVFQMVVEFNPTVALRVIRASRETRCSDDLMEKNPTRRRALARAHRKLGRKQFAERLDVPKD